MKDEATREPHDSPESPTPPTAEASAFVASVLSGCDQHLAVGAGAPSLIAQPEPAPLESNSIAAGSLPAAVQAILSGPPLKTVDDHVSVLNAVDKNEYSILRSPPATAPPSHSNATIFLILIGLAVLLFGSGVAVGYRISGRPSRADSNKSTLQESVPSTVRSTAPSKTVDAVENQAGVPSAADAAPVNPALNSETSVPPLTQPIAQGQAKLLPDSGSDNDLQKPPAQPPSTQSQPSHVIVELLHPPASSSSVSAKPDPGQRPASAALPVSVPSSRPPSSNGGMETPSPNGTPQEVGTFAQAAQHFQPVHPQPAPISSVRSGNTPAVPPPGVPGITASSGIAPGGPDAHVLPDGLADEPAAPAAEPQGDINSAQLIHSVQPVYPTEAKKLHVAGDVRLRVVVGADGTVENVSVVYGPPALAPAAMEAARQFRYNPALLDGKPIETMQTIDMSFKLEN